MSRNNIYDALLALGTTITGSFGSIQESGRRVKQWDKVQKPALFQVEPDDDVKSQLGTRVQRTLKVTWLIYHDAGRNQSVEPSRTSADIIDAIEVVMPNNANGYQTLGGLVYAAWVNGVIRKFEGDIDGQTIIAVPISILIP